jgi:hypothetical protein
MKGFPFDESILNEPSNHFSINPAIIIAAIHSAGNGLSSARTLSKQFVFIWSVRKKNGC